MGESKRRETAVRQERLTALGVETLCGRVQVRWNPHEAATPYGQMAYFAEFLNLTGLYRRWIEDCPFRFASPNGSRLRRRNRRLCRRKWGGSDACSAP